MSTLIELAGRLDDDAGIVHAFATGIYDDLRDQIVRDLRDAAAALRAAETGQACVCRVDDGLVQEWISRARAVAQLKGLLPTPPRAQPTTTGE